MENIKMKNEAEFIFDNVLNIGFTVVPNEIFDDERLTNNAIAVYCKIIRRRNIQGWKIYQSTLVNKRNGKDKIASAIKELVEYGWLTKERLRNEKGQVQGMRYTVYSTSQIKEESHVEPKADFPKQEKPKQEKPLLKRNNTTNKEITNKKITNKDTTQSQYQDTCSNSYNDILTSSNQVEIIENNTHLKLSKNQVLKTLTWNVIRLRKSIEIFREQEGRYFALLEKIYKDNGNFAPKSNKPANTTYSNSKQSNFDNFTQREYDYNKLEKQLLGWDNSYDEEDNCEIEN